jgi:hypothetical protein
MRRTGAAWTERGKDAVLALRCLRLSGLLAHGWQRHGENERRADAEAA